MRVLTKYEFITQINEIREKEKCHISTAAYLFYLLEIKKILAERVVERTEENETLKRVLSSLT